MTVHGFHELASHLKTDTPILVTQILRRSFRNIISKVKHNRNLCQSLELLHWHRHSRRTTCQSINTLRYFVFRKDKTSWLISCHAFHSWVLHGDHPSRETTCRMSNEHRFTHFINHGINGRHILCMITDVWSQFTEELRKAS